MTDKPNHADRGHSPLGASGAERWMKCPGSVALIKRIRQLLDAMGIGEEDDPDYRREGTAMHECAADCLERGIDTWEIVGETYNDTVIDAEMADAIQLYLDTVRKTMDAAEAFWIEYGISSPIHPSFYGTLDFGAYVPHGEFSIRPGAVTNRSFVDVTDLKGGQGILVDPDENPQLMYYGYGLIENHPEWPDDLPVRLRIAQPRGYADEKVREWWTTVGAIKKWVHEELVPAMIRTSMDDKLEAGPWCRFCPAKLICPLLTGLFRAAAVANPKELVNLDDARIGLSYQHIQAVKFYITGLEAEAFRRLNQGRTVPGTKMVPKKANRVFSADAEPLAKARFGAEALTPAKLKSPAELEKISPAAAEFVKEHAYMPNTGYTVAVESDPRVAVVMKRPEEAFKAALDALKVVDGQFQKG